MNSYRKVLPIISLIKPLEPESGWWSSAVGLEWQGCVRAKLSVTWKPVTFDTSLHLSQSPTSSPAPGNSHSFTCSYELQVKKNTPEYTRDIAKSIWGCIDHWWTTKPQQWVVGSGTSQICVPDMCWKEKRSLQKTTLWHFFKHYKECASLT